MTANQLKMLDFKERERHNKVTETEDHRSNVAKETETNRSNLEAERNKRSLEGSQKFSNVASGIGSIARGLGSFIPSASGLIKSIFTGRTGSIGFGR